MASIVSTRLMVGLEVHVELSCRTKAFSRSLSVARSGTHEHEEPNQCIDPVVLGLPGALPVVNEEAVRQSICVGLALGCSIAPVTRWDRKSYFYADMPKGYQISQYDRPICFDGAMDIPLPMREQRGGSVEADYSGPTKRIGIIRAHLEEDAGKLLHDAPGGGSIEHSILDLNRAGTALLEIVTAPDFSTAEEVVIFCQELRRVCRFLGVTEGVMQKGHMRFEPNVNCVLTLSDGRIVKTPIVEVKNLNSFKAVRGAIEYEASQQPQRWLEDGIEMGAGTKQTRGWNDAKSATYVMREKEDAHDYRYFPDPDLLPVTIEPWYVEQVRQSQPELPAHRLKRYMKEFELNVKDSAALVEERSDSEFYQNIIEHCASLGVSRSRAGKAAANIMLQSGLKRVNATGTAEQSDETTRPALVSALGISAEACAGIIALREQGVISAQAGDELFGLMCAEPGGGNPERVRAMAERMGMIRVQDEAAIDGWVKAAIEANASAAADVRAGKEVAVGRIVGAAMKLAGGKADAAELKKRILNALRA